METIMSKKEKERAVSEEMLTKEFLSPFKTEQDVSKFLKKLHAKVLEQIYFVLFSSLFRTHLFG